MKPRFLEKQMQSHHLEVAFDGAKALNFPVCITSVATPVRRSRLPATTAEAERLALMLVSADAGLGVRLSCTADLAGLAFLQINDSANALRQAAQDRLAVVFVDLDLPELGVWETTEGLLRDDSGPALVLLSGRSNHVEMGAAIQAGAVIEKSAGPAQLLERVDRILAESAAKRVEQKTRQRMLVRWLRPYHWPAPVEPTARHWGINE